MQITKRKINHVMFNNATNIKKRISLNKYMCCNMQNYYSTIYTFCVDSKQHISYMRANGVYILY